MLIGFLIGVLVGGVGMLLIYRNNQAKLTALADKLNKEIKDLKEKK